MTISKTGWNTDDNTWTYASPTSFTVEGDGTDYLVPGTRVTWDDGTNTPGYGVIASNISGTVQLIDNTDFPIADHALTSTKFVYAHTDDFPDSFTWSPTLVGWSEAPADGAYTWHTTHDGFGHGGGFVAAPGDSGFRLLRPVIFCKVHQPFTGTSNSPLHTVSAPVACSLPSSVGCQGRGMFVDNGDTFGGILEIKGGTTELVVSLAVPAVLSGVPPVLVTPYRETCTASGDSAITHADCGYEFASFF